MEPLGAALAGGGQAGQPRGFAKLTRDITAAAVNGQRPRTEWTPLVDHGAYLAHHRPELAASIERTKAEVEEDRAGAPAGALDGAAAPLKPDAGKIGQLIEQERGHSPSWKRHETTSGTKTASLFISPTFPENSPR